MLMILLVEDASGANALPYLAPVSPPPTPNHFLQVFMIARNKLTPVNNNLGILLFIYMKHYVQFSFINMYVEKDFYSLGKCFFKYNID